MFPISGNATSLTYLRGHGRYRQSLGGARDFQLGRDVALKDLRPDRAGNAQLWERFLREAQITGQLEHPGIVPLYELLRRPDDHQPFWPPCD